MSMLSLLVLRHLHGQVHDPISERREQAESGTTADDSPAMPKENNPTDTDETQRVLSYHFEPNLRHPS